MTKTYFDRVFEIPLQPQTQGSLKDQLDALHVAANRLGFYDAADWLRATRKAQNVKRAPLAGRPLPTEEER